MLLDTPICDFGWEAKEFTLNEPSGQSYKMVEQIGPKGLLIMFICNHCPYVKRISKEISEVSKNLISSGVNVLAIMSNDYRDYPEDSPEKMLEFKKTHDFQFPYLLDADQLVGKAYGAVCTPDFFGFNSKGQLQYRGRIEELESAMNQVALSGVGPREQIPSQGCSIKWSR